MFERELVHEVSCSVCGWRVHCSDEPDVEPHVEDHKRNRRGRCDEAYFLRRRVEAITGKPVG